MGEGEKGNEPSPREKWCGLCRWVGVGGWVLLVGVALGHRAPLLTSELDAARKVKVRNSLW